MSLSGPFKKTAHFERNQKPAATISLIAMQHTRERSIAEPSGDKLFKINELQVLSDQPVAGVML
jgi:hypothetical protein